MPRLICTEDGSNKFWEGVVEGSALTVRFGRVGTAGQTKVKTLASPAAATKELEKLVAEKRKKGYLDDDRGAAPARAPMRTYGLRPGDWGEDTEHHLEVKFAAPPGAADKAKIARLFETQLAKSDGDPGKEPWLWSGPWALLKVGEREGDDDRTAAERALAALAAVGEAFQAIDKEVPVAELLFLGLTALHSSETIEVPASDGPDWGLDYTAADTAYRRTCVDPEESPTFDPEFEAARAQAAGRTVKAPAASALTFSPARGKKRPQPSAATAKAFGPGFSAYKCKEAAGQAVTIINNKTLWVLAEGETQARAIDVPGQSGRVGELTLRLDGKAARFYASVIDDEESKKYGGLPRWFEVALPAGTVSKLPAPPFTGGDPHPHFVRDGLVLYFCGQRLILCGPDGQTELASLTFADKGGPFNGLVCLGGRAVIFAVDLATELVGAVAIGKDRLVELGRSDRIRCDEPFERDGHVFAGGQELSNLRELVDAALGPA